MIAAELAENAGAWFNDEQAIGSRDVVDASVLRSGRTIAPRIGLIAAIVAPIWEAVLFGHARHG